LVEALKKDYTTAPITPPERVMVEYVVKLTTDATRVWKDDIEGLRAAGFDDRGILQITLIASWFHYINRMADALGWGGTSAFRTFRRIREPWLEPEPLPTGAAQIEGLAPLCCPGSRIPHPPIPHHTAPISKLTPDGLTPSAVGHSGSLRSIRRAPSKK
jgi:hypothetical protein